MMMMINDSQCRTGDVRGAAGEGGRQGEGMTVISDATKTLWAPDN